MISRMWVLWEKKVQICDKIPSLGFMTPCQLGSADWNSNVKEVKSHLWKYSFLKHSLSKQKQKSPKKKTKIKQKHFHYQTSLRWSIALGICIEIELPNLTASDIHRYMFVANQHRNKQTCFNQSAEISGMHRFFLIRWDESLKRAQHNTRSSRRIN